MEGISPSIQPIGMGYQTSPSTCSKMISLVDIPCSLKDVGSLGPQTISWDIHRLREPLPASSVVPLRQCKGLLRFASESFSFVLEEPPRQAVMHETETDIQSQVLDRPKCLRKMFVRELEHALRSSRIPHQSGRRAVVQWGEATIRPGA